MSKAKFNAAEWEKVKDAPFWVHAAVHAADGRQSLLANRKEDKALDKVMSEYKATNALVRDVIGNDDDPAKAIGKASVSDAEQALKEIAQIVERKSGDDLDAFNDFLLAVGGAVAEAAKEGLRGDRTSEEESKALDSVTRALGATESDKRQRRQAKRAAEQEEKAAAAAKARAAAEKAGQERVERLAAQKAAADKAAAERAAAEKKAAEAAAREEAARAKQRADAIARREKLEKEAAERRLAAEKKAAAEKAVAEEAAAKEAAAQVAQYGFEIMAEYTVVSGDNLSFISDRFYGTQANWQKIYQVNKDVIGDNPSLIRVGQVLKIPKL